MVRQEAEVRQETGEGVVLTAEELIIQSLRYFEGTITDEDSLIRICGTAGHPTYASSKGLIDRMVVNKILIRLGTKHKSWYRLNPSFFTKGVRKIH